MIYQIYFLVFLVTLLVTFVLVYLYKEGYRIKFEDKHFYMEKIQRGVKFVTQKLANVSVKTSGFLTQSKGNEELYGTLKSDFPNLDFESLKNKVRNYILNYLKNDQETNNIIKTNTFTNDMSNLICDKDIDNQSLIILGIILDDYSIEDGLAKIEFNTQIEYNRNYENGVSREVQENYIIEFVNVFKTLKKTKKTKCLVCGNELTISNNNTKCTKCNQIYCDDIWYLNKIEKI